jgi:CRP-like cAMP-binding protein
MASSSSQTFQNFALRYAAGDRIFSDGDLGATMFVVQSGRVRLFRIVEGQTRTHAIMEKGDFFGEASVLEGVPRTTSAEAMEETELIEINTLTFDRMIRGNIEIAVRMLRKLSLRLRDAERRSDSSEAAPASVPRTGATARPVVRPTAAEGVRLEVEGAGMVFALVGAETLIGRYDPVTDTKPDVDLTPLDLKRTVSRHHARIVLTEEGYFISEEVGALNGSFVNGAKLVSGRPHPLVDGDKIGLGMVKLVFRT